MKVSSLVTGSLQGTGLSAYATESVPDATEIIKSEGVSSDFSKMAAKFTIRAKSMGRFN